MKKLQISKYFMILFACVVIFIPNFINAQALSLAPQISIINVHGTSNVRDWDMKPNKVSGVLTLNNSEEISTISLEIVVNSLKSGNRIMDGKTYGAFDDKKNPNITFQLIDISPSKLSYKDSEVTLTGNLTMAGQTRKISFKAICKITEEGGYQLKGSVPLKMTDFKMKPPTAMLGTMKTGDAVTIKFDVTFKGN